VFDGFDFDVTFTVVIQITPAGVPVIVKLLVALLVLVDVVKNGAAPEPSSFFEFTSIVTPCDGMVEVIVTVSGKSVWGAGACVDPSGGVSVTARFASVGGGGGGGVGDLLPQRVSNRNMDTV
jgi:hypothetical protein